MKLRSLFLTVVLALGVLMGAVAAQEDVDLCFGLSADDCAAIDEASANGIGQAQSFTVELDIDFEAAGIPAEASGGLESIVFIQSGSVDVVPTTDGLVIPFDIGGSFEVSFAQNGDDLTTLPINFALVADIFYIQEPGADEWVGINLIEVLSDEAVGEQLDEVLGAFDDGMEEGGDVDEETLDLAVDLLTLPGLLDYVRDGDDFVFTVDLGAFAALQQDEELLNSVIDAASAVDPTVGSLIPIIPLLVDEGTITVVQTVNPELNIVDRIQFGTDLSLELGLALGDPTLDPTTVNLAVDLRLTNLDSAPAPEAPAEFEDVTADVIEGMQ